MLLIRLTFAVACLAHDLAGTSPQALFGQEDPAGRYAGTSNAILPEGKKGVMALTRFAPGTSTLYIANNDGSNLRKLLGNDSLEYAYHASWSSDGQYIVFTSERNGGGQADLYRVKADGTNHEELVATPWIDDQGVLSPDSTKLAYVSSANSWKANIWVKDLQTGLSWNLTDNAAVRGESWSPDGYFKPAWSPDGQWIAFTSDRNTAWTGHGDGTGWEHTQELSIYAIRADGTDFRLVASKEGYCLGSPQWSPDGSRLVYYELERTQTYNVRNPTLHNDAANQIWSVNFLSGETKQETSTIFLKISPQYVEGKGIGYLVKGDRNTSGLYYTSNEQQRVAIDTSTQTNPSWSPDGKQVVFEALYMGDGNKGPVAAGAQVYSWEEDWEYRISPAQGQALSKTGKIVKVDGRGSSLVVSDANGSNNFTIPIVEIIRNATSAEDIGGNPMSVFFPTWSPSGEHIVVGIGAFFQARRDFGAAIYRVRLNDSYVETFTDPHQANSGMASYNPDPSQDQIVYRVWGPPSNGQYGLRILDFSKNETTVLTNNTLNDNLPQWSPDGSKIVFTRRMNTTNFDICTIRPDGTNLQVLTTSGANDGHASWTPDGRILWSSGSSGWKSEAASYDISEQPYGSIWVMDADGGNKQQLTDTLWEDGLGLYIPREFLS